MNTIPRRGLIGVLGGMGPAATVDFMSKILKATRATCDQEHVPLIVHHVPQIPDRSTAIQRGSDEPWLPLLAGALMLDRSGVILIAMPCNAAHYWHERLSRATRVEIAHIADAVGSAIKTRAEPINRLALMAAAGTIAGRIYEGRLNDVVNELTIPNVPIQNLINKAILAVKVNDLQQATNLAEEAASRLLDGGADALLLACTELPIAMQRGTYAQRSIDATEALARICVSASLGAGPLVSFD